MKNNLNQWRVFIVLFFALSGCRESRWAVEVPQSYTVVAKTEDKRLRESAVCYELSDASGGKFGEILRQANFVKGDEDELDAAVKEAALALHRSKEDLRAIFTTCLKAEGRDCDAWLLVEQQGKKAILLMTRG